MYQSHYTLETNIALILSLRSHGQYRFLGNQSYQSHQIRKLQMLVKKVCYILVIETELTLQNKQQKTNIFKLCPTRVFQPLD